MPGWDDGDDFERCLEVLWQLDEQPTALLTYDDLEAVRAMRWLSRRGLRVPQDISIVALQYTGRADQCSVYSDTKPDITCKAGMQDDMAKIAAEKLIQMIEHPGQAVESASIEPRLVIRDSTGPCPS